MKFIAIKTNEGYYITDNIENKGYHTTSINRLKVNGQKPEHTFHSDWFLTKHKPKTVERETGRPSINRRYELKASETFPKLKKVYKFEDVVLKESCSENDYTDELTEEFGKIASLYEYKSEPGEMLYEQIEFSMTVIAEMKKMPEKGKFEYEVQRTRWEHEGTFKLTEKDIILLKHIDKIIVPPILKHTRECFIDRQNTYKIIREYIKEHINLKYAEIYMDYENDFAVNKIIGLVEPVKYTCNVNALTRRRPRYVQRFRETKKKRVFSMCWEARRNSDEPIIERFKGKSQKDLKKNIDKYLKELIERINKPLMTCPTCKGYGVLEKEEKE